MENFPWQVGLIFGLIAMLTVYTFYKATNSSKLFLWGAIGWIVIQGIASVSGFYAVTDAMPPRILFLIAPAFLIILYLFLAPRGRLFQEGMDIHMLMVIHIIRAPLELVTCWLFLCRALPYEMTFVGGNPDLLAGMTVPVVYYLGLMRRKVRWQMLIVWNVVGIGLLVNSFFRCLLSAPLIFQTYAFEQPNLAVLHFPLIFLPGCVVPIMLFAHVVVIRKLLIQYRFTPKSSPVADKFSIHPF
ncbi:hypothetical protein DYBT9275_00478 [Dyadobacter sp. CECT 9275]|uniref:Uncharacterized protein n=1 Tax=Dyadobacter helix TaxID=2822344 RepID=A0A916J8F8_9BACT|nr:hypothetical protein [Dyadobacter sp. CECT 9275]CAG4990209.1 hypothetical protein DYBT9275_00478 [Dyadobacter sp. CECT 9275]